MTHPAPENPLVALREEIRRAGRLIPDYKLRGIRLWFFVTVGVLAAGAVLLPGVVESRAYLLLLPLPALLWGSSLAARQRRRLKAILRDTIRNQRGPEVEAVLESMAWDTDPREMDAAALARELLRELGPPTELTPSGTPVGSGAEMSGVPERTR